MPNHSTRFQPVPAGGAKDNLISRPMPATGCKRVQRFGICPLLTGHWRLGNDGQLCSGHFVKTSTRLGPWLSFQSPEIR
jgi:hypothetical protein